MFPVDLPDVEDLTSASEQYLSALQAEPLMDKYFCSSLTSKVLITPSNVTRLQLFDDDQPPCCVLALHPPDDPTEGSIDDGETDRLPAQSSGGQPSSGGGAVLSSSSHREPQNNVERRRSGYLCSGWSLSYVLPVLDSLQVRCRCRRRGFGFHMLDDFCSSFSTEDFLGISSPVSPNMAAVLLRFLGRSVAERDRLYEVEPPGDWTQRRNIWLGFQLGRYALGPVDEGSVTSLELQMDPALGSTQEIRPRPNRSCRKSGPGSGSAAHAGHSDSKARRSEDPQERRRRAGRPRRPRRT